MNDIATDNLSSEDFFKTNIVTKFASMPSDIYISLSSSNPIVGTVVDVIRQAISEFKTTESTDEPKPNQ